MSGTYKNVQSEYLALYTLVLLKGADEVVALEFLPVSDEDRLDGPGRRGLNNHLHLHGREYRNSLPFLDFVAFLNLNSCGNDENKVIRTITRKKFDILVIIISYTSY